MAKKIGVGIALDGEKEFRSAISGINSDMKVLASEMKKVTAEFSDNNNSIEALTAKDEVLNKQLDTQRQKVDALRLALQNSQEQYGENDTRTDKWKISLNNAEAEMSKLTKDIRDNNTAMEKAKNPTENLGKEFKNVGKNAEDAGKKALSMGDIIKANVISAGIINGVQSLASKFASLATGALDSADSIQQMADQTGMSAESIQEWQYVGDTVGTSIDTITGANSKLIKSMSNAVDGNKTAVSAFKELGVSVTDSSGNMRSSQDVFNEAIDALGRVSNETERTALAQKIFGKSAAELNPLISAGSEQLKSLAQQAKDSGAVMSNETVSSLDNLGDTMGQVKESIAGIAGTILGQFAPALTDIANKVKENAPAIQETVKNIADKVGEFIGFFVDHGSEVIAVIGGIAAGFVAWNVVTMIQGVVGAIKAFQLANEGATIAQMALNLAMNANPIGIIITAIAALVAGIIVLWNTNKDFRNAVTAIFKEISSGFKAAWDAVSGFITKTIPDAFNGLVKFVQSIPSKFLEAGKNMIKFLWNGISGLNDWIIEKVTGFGGKIVKGVASGLTGIADIGLNLVKGIWNGISDATDWILDKIKGFGSAILGGIKSFFGIKSPSRLFRDEVGTYLAQGIGVGFTDEMKNVTSSMNKSIPTDFSVNGSYNVTGSAKSVGNIDANTYNAFAAVATNILVPVIKKIGANFTIEPDVNGIFKLVQKESQSYYVRTGTKPFPA